MAKKKALVDFNSEGNQEGVMDSLMEALKTGSAFSRDQKRKRAARYEGGQSYVVPGNKILFVSDLPGRRDGLSSTGAGAKVVLVTPTTEILCKYNSPGCRLNNSLIPPDCSDILLEEQENELPPGGGGGGGGRRRGRPAGPSMHREREFTGEDDGDDDKDRDRIARL